MAPKRRAPADRSERMRSKGTRDALIDAALKCFLVNGYRQTTLQEIVESAGLTKGAFYHHFTSKEDVLLIAHENYLDRQMAIVTRVRSKELGSSATISQVIAAMITGVVEHRAELALFLEERRSLRGAAFESIRSKRHEFEVTFTELLSEGVESGEFDLRPEDCSVAALSLIGMISWTYQWLKDDHATSVHVAQVMADLALDGLRTRPRQ